MHTFAFLFYTVFSLKKKIRGIIQFLYMSHRTFSMGVFPIVFWKNTASILMAGIILKRGSISSSLPNLATWPGSCVRQCCHNMTWAWSWRFSIWLGSLSPLVSENTNVIARHSRISWSFEPDIYYYALTCSEENDGLETSEFCWIDVNRLEPNQCVGQYPDICGRMAVFGVFVYIEQGTGWHV